MLRQCRCRRRSRHALVRTALLDCARCTRGQRPAVVPPRCSSMRAGASCCGTTGVVGWQHASARIGTCGWASHARGRCASCRLTLQAACRRPAGAAAAGGALRAAGHGLSGGHHHRVPARHPHAGRSGWLRASRACRCGQPSVAASAASMTTACVMPISTRTTSCCAASEVFLVDFDRCTRRRPGLWRDANLARLRRSLDALEDRAQRAPLRRRAVAVSAGRMVLDPGDARAVLAAAADRVALCGAGISVAGLAQSRLSRQLARAPWVGQWRRVLTGRSGCMPLPWARCGRWQLLVRALHRQAMAAAGDRGYACGSGACPRTVRGSVRSGR